MALSPGDRLGPYEILAQLGAGGMGEVYRAKDPRIDRTVALKVLPEEFFEDEERRVRFGREARTLASLNHPGIAVLFSFEEVPGSSPSSSRHLLTMELVEGEPLSKRMKAGTIPMGEALSIGRDIASALEAAHAKGIVHRDLKPGNVMISTDGRVKLLDFGLAKVFETEPASPDLSHSPTLTAAGTEAGVILGTAAYMSPEQARGQRVDARTDVWAFGVVLWELLTGRRLFRGQGMPDTLAAVLREPVDFKALPLTTPRAVRDLLARCLERDPEKRLADIGEARRTLETAAAGGASRRFPVLTLVAAAGVVILLAAGGVYVARHRPAARSREARPPQIDAVQSLAVLPFANAGSDPNFEYLSDGITDALINSLAQLPNLTVMSRDAVSHYKGLEVSAQTAGRELKAQAVLKGKFEQRDGSLSVSAELVEVRDDSHLWGGQFNRKLSELQALQGEMAEQISTKLRTRLTDEERRRLRKRYTEDPEAYQLYLRGRYFWEQRMEEPIKKSISYFDQAIEKDPAFAQAYAGLSASYAVSVGYSVLSPREAIPKSRAAAERALEIDENLAQAHATLGWSLWTYDWRYAAAEEELKKATMLDPRDATGHFWYGVLFMTLGRTDEAVAQLQRAREISPFQSIIQSYLVRAYFFARKFDWAVEEARNAPANNAAVHARLGDVYLLKGERDRSAAEYRKAADLLKRNAQGLWYLGMSQAAAGHRLEAHKTIAEMGALAGQRYVSPVYVAHIYVALGEKDRALEWLEKAYADHSWDLIFLNVNPLWDPLRTDPRFGDLLRRLNQVS